MYVSAVHFLHSMQSLNKFVIDELYFWSFFDVSDNLRMMNNDTVYWNYYVILFWLFSIYLNWFIFLFLLLFFFNSFWLARTLCDRMKCVGGFNWLVALQYQSDILLGLWPRRISVNKIWKLRTVHTVRIAETNL